MISFATQKLMSKHIFCLKNKAFTSALIFKLALLSLLLPSCPSDSHAQEPFNSEYFNLTIPVDYERVQHKDAVLVIRNKTKGFPTFNAIISPGPWPYQKLSAAEQAQRIAENYHLVGLNSAKTSKSSLTEIDGRTSLQAEIQYSIAKKDYSSYVWLISLSDKHLVFTAVFNNTSQNSEIEQVNHMVKGIKIRSKTAETEVANQNELTWQTKPIILILLLLMVSYGIFWVFTKKSR